MGKIYYIIECTTGMYYVKDNELSSDLSIILKYNSIVRAFALQCKLSSIYSNVKIIMMQEVPS